MGRENERKKKFQPIDDAGGDVVEGETSVSGKWETPAAKRTRMKNELLREEYTAPNQVPPKQ